MTEPGAARESITLGGARLDRRAAIGLTATTLLLMVGFYYQPFGGDSSTEWLLGQALESLLLYLVAPLLLIRLGFGDSPAAYGVGPGDWRQGLRWTAVVVLLAVPILLVASGTPAMQQYYRNYRGELARLVPLFALDLLGWEFIFRGFLLFCLLRVMGPTAIVAQAVPFALAHLTKPPLETLSTIFGGTLFGWVAWRSKSFVYPWLIHLAIFSLNVAIATAGGS